VTNAPGSEPGAPSPAAPDQVWLFDEHPGFGRAIEGAGTVAAPLLAGFAFTLLVLTLPTLAEKKTTVRLGGGEVVVVESQAFSRLPELAAVLLLLAGLLLIMSVQAGIYARYYAHRPADLEEWYPQYFREDRDFAPSSPPAWMEWNTTAWPAVQVGEKWYGGWARRFLFQEGKAALRWYSRARNLYHLGILSLLSGVALMVVPPASDADAWRWLIAAVAAAGTLAELAWIVSGPWAGLLARLRGQAPSASGGDAPIAGVQAERTDRSA